MPRASATRRLEAKRDEALRLIASLERQRAVPKQLVRRKNIARFALAARERLHVEDALSRKGYVHRIVERIEVADDTITLRGAKAAPGSCPCLTTARVACPVVHRNGGPGRIRTCNQAVMSRPL